MPIALFWNLNRKALGREVAQLCKIHNVDILVIAEAGLPDVALQHLLSQETKTTYIAPFNEFSSRVKFFFRYPPESIRLVADSYGLSIREVRPPIGESLLLVGVHLSSKLYADRNEQSAQARLAICTIAEAEQSVGHKRTLIIGDFNMNPFEGGLVDADTFYGVMDQSIAKENMRTVRQVERRFFYNPMWGKLGDSSEGPPGTYYYKSSKNREFFWNTFDQVLIRPELIPFYQEGLLKVLTEIYDTQLMTDGKISNDFSDHLPIMIKLATE